MFTSTNNHSTELNLIQPSENWSGSEEQYRILFEYNPHPMWVYDLETLKFLVVNQAAIQRYGYSNEEFLKLKITDIRPAEERERRLRQITKIENGPRAAGDEWTHEDKFGTRIIVEINSYSLNFAGRPAALIVATDITERKRAEREAKEAEKRFRAVIESLGEALLITDLEDRVIFMNSRASSMTGYSLDEMMGCPAYELLLPQESWKEMLERNHGRNGGTVGSYEIEVTRKDGSTIWVNVNGSPYQDSSGNVVGTIGSMTDITDRKRTEEALRESREHLRHAQKLESIGTLAGGVAHDFNNLLTAILGSAQLALTRFQPDQNVRERLIEIESAANSAATLTKKLLAFGRRQRLDRRPINLGDTVLEVMKMVQRIIGSDIDVQINSAGNLGTVVADPAQIEQVIMNLGINARDAMPEGGSLTIETRNVILDEAFCRSRNYPMPGRHVEIVVTDTGTGMDEETRNRIFEPFFTTKEVGKGTGLGLATVYGIIKQHDGLIEVSSQIGMGTTFRICLPEITQPVTDECFELTQKTIGGNETILLAEDEPALRFLAREALEGLGYNVCVAANGEEALAAFLKLQGKIDLALLDVVMPILGGFEAARQMVEKAPDLAVLYMTGYSAEMVQGEAKEDQRFTVIQKPYTIDGLGSKVREVLDRAHAESCGGLGIDA